MTEMKTMIPAALGLSRRQGGAITQQIAGGVRVTHSELFATINSSTGFTAIRSIIQPGSSNFSTWLAAQSAQYDQYVLRNLVLEYEPKCGTNNSGTVMIGYDYDPSDRNPINEQAFSTYLGTLELAPYVEGRTAMVPSAVHATGPRKFLRSGPVSGDLRTYDCGTIIYATQDGPAVPILWGKLWITYTFDLLVPTAPQGPNLSTQAYVFETNAPFLLPVGNVIVPFNTVVTNFDADFIVNAGGSLTAPVGSFLVMAYVGITGTSGVNVFSGNVNLSSGPTVVQSSPYVVQPTSSNSISYITLYWWLETTAGTVLTLAINNTGLGIGTCSVATITLLSV